MVNTRLLRQLALRHLLGFELALSHSLKARPLWPVIRWQAPGYGAFCPDTGTIGAGGQKVNGLWYLTHNDYRPTRQGTRKVPAR